MTARAPRRRRPPVALPLAVAAILLATLTPASHEGAAGWDGCLLCGDRGAADAVLNVLLFAPLGAALARRSPRWPRAIGMAAALSAAVEAAQLLVPGRDPSPPDLLFNTLGAAAGYALGRRMGVVLHPSHGRLAVAWSLAFAAMVAATGWLAAPAPPAGPYVGQWTPETGDHPLLPARILDARIGALPVPSGGVGAQAEVRMALARGEPVTARWIVGRRIAEPAPLLRIVGRGGEEAAALFIHGEALIVVRRTRAGRMRLDQPVLRAPGVRRGIVPGDTVTLRIRFHGRGARMDTDQGWRADDGVGPGRGWSLLMARLDAPRGAERRMDGLWLAAWMVPLGVWLRCRPASAAALGIVVAALFAVPWMAGLAPARGAELIGAGVGLVAGVALRRVAPRGIGPPAR